MTRAAGAGDRITSSIELTRRIGAGGMGTVWIAKHHALRKDVVVKLMAESMVDSDELRRRFTQEAAGGANVKSPYVVQVFDTGVSDDFGPYIVMELLEGEDLGARLTRDGKVSAADVVRIVTQVGQALDRAHAIDLVHRDVKPANIFLCKEDGSFTCKVLDFGVARWRDGAMPVTEAGVSLGTVTYMSPEQAAGRDDLDGTSDLYALGLVAFRALTGAPAFSRASFDSLGLGVYNLPVPKITEREASLPAAIDDWFARACAREPARRFRDGASMAAELASAIGIAGAATNEPSAITEAPMSGGPTRARVPVPAPDAPEKEKEPTAPGTDSGLAQPTSPATPVREQPSRRPLFLGLAAIVTVGAVIAATRSSGPSVMPPPLPSSSAAASASASADADTIPIGVLLDLSGERRNMGEALLAATVAAQTRINQSGGVRGKKLRLVVKDDQGDTGSFLTEATKALVETKGLKVILGPSTSAQVKIVAPIAQRAGVVEITGSATSPSLTTLQRAEERLLFRTVPSQTIQARTLARVMRGGADAGTQCKAIAFVARDDLEGRPFTEALSRLLTESGARVVETRYVEAEARADYGEEVRAIARSKADCLVLSMSPKAAARYLRQASAGERPANTFAVSTLATDDFLTYARDDARDASSKTVAEGVRGVRPATSPTWRPEYVELTHLLTQIDGGASAVGVPFVPNQFDAAMFAAMTLESAGPDADAAALRKAFHGIARGGTVYGPQEIAQLMAALRRGAAVDYVGASGDVEVDANGDVEGDLVAWKVEHGAIVETARLDP